MCSLVTCSLVWERLKANARIWPQPLSFLVMLVGPHFHRLIKLPEFFSPLKLSKSFLFHFSRDSFASYLSEDAMALQDGSAQDELPFNSAVGETNAEAETPVVSLDSAVGERPLAWRVHFSAADVEAIQNVRGIANLRQLMLDVKVRGPVGWRPVLAHHTTTACQPRKQTGTIDSLIVGGLDKVTWRNNQFEVTTLLPNAFADGDRISIEAVGSSTNMKGAKENCVHKLLSLLLALGPEKVHLHPNFFIVKTAYDFWWMKLGRPTSIFFTGRVLP